jgi:hypothetical protein
MRTETAPAANGDEPTPHPDRRETAQRANGDEPAAHADRTGSEPAKSSLTPTEPPGRRTRKARQFEGEIARLRERGYTLAAIRQTLLAVGVAVSVSTVRREARRSAGMGRVAAQVALHPARSNPPHSVPASSAEHSPVTPLPPTPRGKEVAEAFMRSHVTNPLMRTRPADPLRDEESP